MTDETELSAILSRLDAHSRALDDLRKAIAEVHRVVTRIEAMCPPCQRAIAAHEAALFGADGQAERGLATRVIALETAMDRVRARYGFVVTSLLSAALTLVGGVALAGICWYLGLRL